MSWLFGMDKGQNPPVIPDIQLATAPPGGGGDDNNKGGSGQGRDGSKMEAYRFDSAALERAAQAARDLEKSGKYNVLIDQHVFGNLFCKVNVW